MIKSIEARYFRRHEDLHIDFTRGLNVLRGSNEAGKTTVTEIILYALYGAASLVDKLEEVVTWGHKESELKTAIVISISGTDYTFTRSKSGAECRYRINEIRTDVQLPDRVTVTGQKEVTAFAAALLGADAKTASVLMLSSQAGLRGALDEGPAAVGALMGKLADFDTIDKLLDTAAKTLALGSIVPLQAKLAEADAEVVAATAAIPDPATLAALNVEIEALAAKHAAATIAGTDLCEAVARADSARDAASLNNGSYEVTQLKVLELTSAVNDTRGRLADAVKAAANRPDPAAVAAARQALADAQNHQKVSEAYSTFKAIPAYPSVAWDEPKPSFDKVLAEGIAAREALNGKVRDATTEIAAARRRLIPGDGKCPTCGTVAANHDHVIASNLLVDAAIKGFEASIAPTRPALAEIAQTIADMNSITEIAVKRQTYIDRCAAYVTVDDSVYPSKVTWANGIPEANADVPAKKLAVDTLAQQEHLCVLAEGKVGVYRESIEAQEKSLAAAVLVAARIFMIPVGPLQEAYDAAYGAYTAQSAVIRELGFSLEELRAEKAEMVRLADGAELRVTTAKARVAEYVADIATMEFNNELVRKLKSMKPQITDFLWNNVLAAVGNFFSVLRGEQSIVTKDATGFKVNGRGGSLSGSTLDMLALSIRVALSKTFVPSSNFLILDEPAHGCDSTRAGALLGFLSGAGFEQTILASHDELSESVADNVIVLGT